MSERAVVFGANGYLGRHLSHELAGRGALLRQSGRASKPAYAVGEYVSANLTDDMAIGELVRDADEVYFAAGLTGTGVAFDRYDDFVQANEVGLWHVLNAMRRQDSGARLVFPSTRLVYRGGPGTLAEDSELQPKTPYALSKVAGEQLLRMYGQCFDLRWVALRVCVSYGEEIPGPRPGHGTVSAFLAQARRGEDLVVFGEGSQRRTLTHIADIAAMMVAAARDERTNAQVLNLGGPDHLSIREIAEAIASASGVSVREEPWPELAARIESGDTVFDATKLETLIGRGYRYGFRDWLMSESARGR